MRLEPTTEGFTIDAEDLARLLEIGPSEVRRLLQAGAITSRVERGEGADAGRFRLTWTWGARRVRLIVAEDGRVLQRSRSGFPPETGR
jgi:hypothetical protein